MNADVSKFQVVFDARNHTLTEADKDRMRIDLDSLAKQAGHFPVADLHVLVEHNARGNDYAVKLSLILPGQTLVGTDRGANYHAAFERCLTGLEDNLRAYKDRLDRVPDRQKHEKGTLQEVEPSLAPDGPTLDAAVRDGDYAAFRGATLGYEEAVRKRAGRWVGRFPDVQARIGRGLTIDDVVEEVFLNAFEGYSRRPVGVRLGDWLETLIDPAVRALHRHTDAELDNINLARSARDAGLSPEGA
jgi:ribosome-associated translation inhibitor RaiA